MRADVAVIIVNYGTADMAIAAADSVLARSADGRTVEIHIVDNASPGDDRAVLGAQADRWGPAVTLHLEDTNHGFGRGNNVVLRALAGRDSPPDLVYFLNPDARLVTNTIAELSGFLADHPAAAVVGSGILHEATGQPVTSAFRFPGVLSEFEGSVHLGIVSRLLRRWAVPLAADIPVQQVGWVAGASVMARLRALTEVGFFDPDFFLYYEEVELMHRINRRGWQIWHLPQSQVIHVGGAATGVSSENSAHPARPAYWYDSWRLYFQKTQGPVRARLTVLSRLVGTLLGNAVTRLRRVPSRNPANFVRDFWDHVVRPMFGLSRPAKAPP